MLYRGNLNISSLSRVRSVDQADAQAQAHDPIETLLFLHRTEGILEFGAEEYRHKA